MAVTWRLARSPAYFRGYRAGWLAQPVDEPDDPEYVAGHRAASSLPEDV